MSNANQSAFPFASLDFSGRGAITLGEIATKLGCTVAHLFHAVDDGTLRALDLARHKGSRRTIRVPLEDYRAYVLARMTAPARREFIAHLPAETLREMAREIAAALGEESRSQNLGARIFAA